MLISRESPAFPFDSRYPESRFLLLEALDCFVILFRGNILYICDDQMPVSFQSFQALRTSHHNLIVWRKRFEPFCRLLLVAIIAEFPYVYF